MNPSMHRVTYPQDYKTLFIALLLSMHLHGFSNSTETNHCGSCLMPHSNKLATTHPLQYMKLKMSLNKEFGSGFTVGDEQVNDAIDLLS